MGVGIWYVGSRIGGLGNIEVVWVERGLAVEQGPAGRRKVKATPLEISEEEPLEVVTEVPLELEGERERMWGDLASEKVTSSSGRGREVG